MSNTKSTISFDEIIQADRQRRKNEELASEIFGRSRKAKESSRDLERKQSRTPSLPPLSFFYGGDANNNNHHQHGGQLPQQVSSRRTSKFPGLRGFVQLNGFNEVPLHYELGQQIPYARVGSVFYINHTSDEEINHRVVVIVRTNNDSWSCYGFCKHRDGDECDSQVFKAEHAQVVSGTTTQANNVDDVPRVMLQLRDASDHALDVDSDVWINCRQMLDIKHTVRMASIGSIHKDSLHSLLNKGLRLFNSTFADRDKIAHANGQQRTPGASTQHATASTRTQHSQHTGTGTSTQHATAATRTPHTQDAATGTSTQGPTTGTTLPHRPSINRAASSSSGPPPVPTPPAPVVRPRGGSGKPKPKPNWKDKAATRFMLYALT